MTEAPKMIAKIEIPVIKDLDTPLDLTATALDDAAFAPPAVEDGEGPTEGLDPESSVDVGDPVLVVAVPDGDMDGAMLGVGVTGIELAVGVGFGTGIPVVFPVPSVSLSWT